MAVGFIIVVIISLLITIIEPHHMLPGYLPVGADGIASGLHTPGIIEFYVRIRLYLAIRYIILHLQTAPQHILTLSAVSMLLVVIVFLVIIVTFGDSLLRTIGILPAFTQRHVEIAKVDISRQRETETVANAPDI
jgi:hypothetical protein